MTKSKSMYDSCYQLEGLSMLSKILQAIAICSIVLALQGCVSDPISPIIAGETARSVIAKAEQAGNSLIGQAERTGSGLISRAGNELNVAVRNASLQLEENLDRTTRNLSRENQLVLSRLDALRKELETMQATAFALEDSLALDTRELMSETIFGDTWFYVQRVEGLAALQGSGRHTLVLKGVGFGTDSDDRRTAIKAVTVGGVPIASYEEVRTGAWTTKIVLNESAIASNFDSNKTRFVDFRIQVKVDRKSTLLGWKSREFELPLKLALYPSTAGELVVTYTYPITKWELLPDRFEYFYTSPNHDQGQEDNPKHFQYTDSRTVADDQRFVGPAGGVPSSGPGCRWTHVVGVDITEAGKRLNLRIDTHGADCTFKYYANVEQRVKLDSQGTMKVPVEYGRSFQLELPQGVTHWRMSGTLIDFSRIDITRGNSQGPILFQDIATTSEKTIVTYLVKRPSGF